MLIEQPKRRKELMPEKIKYQRKMPEQKYFMLERLFLENKPKKEIYLNILQEILAKTIILNQDTQLVGIAWSVIELSQEGLLKTTPRKLVRKGK